MAYISKRRIAPHQKTSETSKRHNTRWNRFYQLTAWKKLREWYMRNHPLCEECLFAGKSTPSEHCHHRVPFSTGATEDEKLELLLSENNLQALCAECHQKIHALLRHQFE